MFHSVSMPARPGECPASCRPSRPSHGHASRSCSSCSFRLGASGVAVTVLQRFEMRWQRRRLRCAPTEVATRNLADLFGKWVLGTMQRHAKATHKKIVSPQISLRLMSAFFRTRKDCNVMSEKTELVWINLSSWLMCDGSESR